MAEASIFDTLVDEIGLIERHMEMLRITKENQPIGIIRLSEMLGQPHHKVRYSLRRLENSGLIVATAEGAVVSEKYDEFIKGLPDSLNTLIAKIEELKKYGSK